MLDDESGLYYYRLPYYMPTVGQFMERDPMSYSAGDKNLFALCFCSPLAKVDPFGAVMPPARKPAYRASPRRPPAKPCPPLEDSCGAEISSNLLATIAKALQIAKLVYPAGGIPTVTFAMNTRWDIGQLFNGPVASNIGGCVPKTKCCQRCVTVNGTRHDRFDVNYALYGALAFAAGWRQSDAVVAVGAWKFGPKLAERKWSGVDPCEDNLQTRAIDWTRVGYLTAKAGAKTLVGLPAAENPYFANCDVCRSGPDVGLTPLPPGKPFEFNLWYGWGTYDWTNGTVLPSAWEIIWASALP